MTIEVTIQAHSADDFLNQLRELSAGLLPIGMNVTFTTDETLDKFTKPQSATEPTVTVTATDAETTAAPEPKAARKSRAAKSEPASSGADAPSSESSTESEAQPSASEASPSPQTSSSPAEEDPGEVGPFPDFDTEVTPVVLGAVRAKGKEWVSAILGEFGVEKASQLADNRFQELIDTINDRMEA